LVPSGVTLRVYEPDLGPLVAWRNRFFPFENRACLLVRMTSAVESAWAEETFGAAELGDLRRTRRLVAMAAGAVRRPSGKDSDVFDRASDREGAYDFLENDAFPASALAAPVYAATAERASGEHYAYVVIDGSQLTLTDEDEEKDFGPIGAPNCPARGLIVMSALAVNRHGVPLGLVDQIYWARPPRENLTRAQAMKRNAEKDFEEKEPSKFIEATLNARDRLKSVGVDTWAIIDREADNRDILVRLAKAKVLFTVRSHWDRETLGEDGLRGPKLREALRAEPLLGTYKVEIARKGGRKAREATIGVHTKLVELRFGARNGKPTEILPVWAVWLREHSAEKDRLDWLVFTNAAVTTMEQAEKIVESYRVRWRIEEFHRTWKQGECHVETSQLRSKEAMEKWATILAAVAMRIERLKYLSRNTPDAPATTELGDDEIEALKLDQRDRSKKKPVPPSPTIKQATEWIAQLGGWIGPANGPPGSITLARGLDRLRDLVIGIRLARQPTRGGR
jgi:hypothetical protein